jgi:ribosomal protein L23
MLKPITTEKAVKLIDLENTLLFETDRRENKDAIAKEVKKLFNVKVVKIRTLTRNNKKFAYVKLSKENPAIDVATKLGMI